MNSMYIHYLHYFGEAYIIFKYFGLAHLLKAFGFAIKLYLIL